MPQDKVFGRPSAPGRFCLPDAGAAGLGAHRARSHQHRRAPAERGMAVHPPLQPARGGAGIDHAVVRLGCSTSWTRRRPGVTPVPLPKAYAPAHGVVVPKHEAQALLAYLLSLKQPALPDERNGAQDRTSAVRAACRTPATAAPQARSRRRGRRPPPAVTMPPRASSCSPPIARPAIRTLAKVCPALSRRSRAMPRSTMRIRPRISTPCCSALQGATSAASNTRARCRHLAARSAMPTSPTSSITSAAPGAITASR